MSAASNHHQWMDPENVGGTTYFYPHHHHPAGGGGSVVDDGQNCVEVVGVDPLEDPLVFPSYSMFSGQPPPHLKDHSGVPGGAVSGGGVDPAARISSLGPPQQNPIVHPSPPHQNHTSFFVPDEVKLELMHRSAVLLSQPNPNLFHDLPTQIDHYHEVCPLENTHHHGPQKSSSFGYTSTVYKSVNSKNGFTYCLRRIHGSKIIFYNTCLILLIFHYPNWQLKNVYVHPYLQGFAYHQGSGYSLLMPGNN